jgi:hypothetical protein
MAETQRQRWVRRTRESVMRQLAREGVSTAGSLVDNLDISWWSSIGPMDVRSQREISAALNWLVQQGFAEVIDEKLRDPYDPPGKLYDLTLEGDAEVAVRWGRGAMNYSRYEEFRAETSR